MPKKAAAKGSSQLFAKHFSKNTVNLPYFDYLLKNLENAEGVIANSFGRHVHWGYWHKPEQATLSTESFAQATEELSRQICLAGHVRNTHLVLDVGCGFGGTIAHINENYQAMRLIGVNLDGRQLSRAREIAMPRAKNSIEFLRGNACYLPLANESIDVVLAVECIFHFPSRELFFKEAFRVLKPGGYLALSDFVSHPFMRPFTRLKWSSRVGAGFYGRCNFQYNVNDYRQLARNTGLSVKTERDITAQTMPTYDYLRRLSYQYRPENSYAVLETLAAELLSRTRLMKYYIYGFQKPS